MTKTVYSRPRCPGRTGIKIVGQSSSCSFLSLGYFVIHILFSKSLISLINLLEKHNAGTLRQK